MTDYLPIYEFERGACPARAHAWDAGLDLRLAAFHDDDIPVTDAERYEVPPWARMSATDLEPGERATVRTGIAVAVPRGYVGDIRPRSGLAARRGLTVLNAPGTIDAGFRGEVQVVVHNAGNEPQTLVAGDRIAQLVLVPVGMHAPRVVESLPAADDGRGSNGKGSTGR